MLRLSKLLDPFGARLLAGADGADRPVRWAHTSELVDPTPFLSGGELLLTNAIQLEDPATQREYLERLAEHGLAGLAIGIGVNIQEVPPAMLEAAEALGFPVYEIPYDVPFIAITERAFRAVAAEQNEILRRALRAQERLEQIVLSEQGLLAIVQELARLVQGTVVVFDGRAEPVCRADHVHPLDGHKLDALVQELQERRAAGHRQQFVPRHTGLDGRGLALPVMPAGQASDGDRMPHAWVVATRDAGALGEFDRLMLRQAVSVVALELLRERVGRDTAWRLASTLLADLARGHVNGNELARRLRRFGLDGPVTALVMPRPEPGEAPSGAAEAAVVAAVREEPTAAVVAEYGTLLTVLTGGPRTEEEALALGHRVRDRVAGELGLPLRMGVGRAVDAPEARTTFHEARCALEALTLANGRVPDRYVATHKDLGSFRFLLALQDEEELRQFSDAVLRPLYADESYGDELVRSLEVYIEEGGHWERSAKRLFCHRHTLRHRVKRIEEQTGRDLGSAADRTEFWLALRASRFYR